MLDTVRHPPQPQGVQPNHLADEFVETLRLAVPMMLTQLGQIAMMTTDLALIGRLGEDAVAAAALAHTVYFVSFTFGLGLVVAVSPLAAQAFAAGDVKRLRHALRAGLWVALLIALPMMASPLYGEQILLALGQAPHSAALAQHYLNGLAWGIAPALGFVAKTPDQSEIGRHHRDLPELRQRHRHGELQRLGELVGQMTAGGDRCSCGRERCGLDFVERAHFIE